MVKISTILKLSKSLNIQQQQKNVFRRLVFQNEYMRPRACPLPAFSWNLCKLYTVKLAVSMSNAMTRTKNVNVNASRWEHIFTSGVD